MEMLDNLSLFISSSMSCILLQLYWIGKQSTNSKLLFSLVGKQNLGQLHIK
jgi:hypothetical protein